MYILDLYINSLCPRATSSYFTTPIMIVLKLNFLQIHNQYLWN